MELVFGCSVNWAEKLENLVPCGFYFPTTLEKIICFLKYSLLKTIFSMSYLIECSA